MFSGFPHPRSRSLVPSTLHSPNRTKCTFSNTLPVRFAGDYAFGSASFFIDSKDQVAVCPRVSCIPVYTLYCPNPTRCIPFFSSTLPCTKMLGLHYTFGSDSFFTDSKDQIGRLPVCTLYCPKPTRCTFSSTLPCTQMLGLHRTFGSETFFTVSKDPASSNRFCIIQYGM